MQIFIIALAVIIAVALVVFIAVKLYAKKKAYRARVATWDRIEQNFETATNNWRRAGMSDADIQTATEAVARAKRQQLDLYRVFPD